MEHDTKEEMRYDNVKWKMYWHEEDSKCIMHAYSGTRWNAWNIELGRRRSRGWRVWNKKWMALSGQIIILRHQFWRSLMLYGEYEWRKRWVFSWKWDDGERRSSRRMKLRKGCQWNWIEDSEAQRHKKEDNKKEDKLKTRLRAKVEISTVTLMTLTHTEYQSSRVTSSYWLRNLTSY